MTDWARVEDIIREGAHRTLSAEDFETVRRAHAENPERYTELRRQAGKEEREAYARMLRGLR